MAKKDWTEEYKKIHPTLETFSLRLRGLIGDLLDDKKIECHAIESRAKSLSSFAEKLSRPGKTYSSPLTEITDLVGMRVIVYYPTDVDVVCSLLRAEFQINEAHTVDTRADADVERFGYSSVHLICSSLGSRAANREWQTYKSYQFEIQIRTVLQHAWASISHALAYTRESQVPPAFRRRLYRLSGLLELADAEFTSLKDQSAVMAKELEQRIKREDTTVQIEPLAILQFMKSVIVKRVSDYAEAAGLQISHHADRFQLLVVCTFLNIESVTDLAKELQRAFQFAPGLFRSFQSLTGGVYSGNPDHWCAVLLVANNRDRFKISDVTSLDLWSPDYAEYVFEAAQLAPQNPIPPKRVEGST